MCGRFTLTAPPDAVAEFLAVADIEPYPPRYNIAPTQPILIVTRAALDRPGGNRAGRSALLARWGLIPSWTKDLQGFPLLFNARSETVNEKNAFRSAMKYRRCLVPATGFYEWHRMAGARSQAYFVRPRDGRPVAFAGLMETWLAPNGSEVDTAAILTTAANDALRPIHDRMPVVVGGRDAERWLDCRDHSPADVEDVLAPADDGVFEAIAISDRVNAIANMGPDIQDRVASASGTEAAG